MEGVRAFLEANGTLITFAYGLTFFVLGLAIALQSLHSSRLELARSLPWLAAFGFTHGVHEWGDLFIPVQAAYFGGQALFLLHRLHLVLLAVSFACLFQFGVALLHPFGWARWLHTVPAAALAVWVFVTLFPLATVYGDFMTWHNAANALARYFLGFPSSLLAAYGLHQHINRWIVPFNIPRIVRPLRLAVAMLVLYAFFSGLVPPPAPFFPASILNSASFADVMVAPPPVFRSIIGLVLALSIIQGLEIFDVETDLVIENMKQQQIVAAERERIGRDLHDGSIQKVYTAGLIAESALKKMKPRSVAARRLQTALTVLDDAIRDLRRNLGELQTSPSSQLLAQGLRDVAEDPRFGSFVSIHLEMDLPEAEGFSAVRAEHVVAIANEALSNVIRHARARKVVIRIRREGDRLVLTMQDDGVGLQAGTLADYGMRNMRDRAHLLGGNLTVNGSGGKGTTVTLDVPWSDGR
jgi:signal transduction histidine kinase